MQPAGRFIKWANPYAVDTIGVISQPEFIALFRIHRPPEQTLSIGYIICFFSWLSTLNGSAGAVIGTFLTFKAEVPYPRFNWFIGD